jgi:hypothetical protein
VPNITRRTWTSSVADDDSARVHGLEAARPGPLHGLERVGGQDVPLYGGDTWTIVY